MQCKSVNQVSLTRSRRYLDPPTALEHLSARGMIIIGYIDFAPRMCRYSFQGNAEHFLDDHVGAFPNDERGGLGVCFDERNAQNECVVLTQVSSAFSALSQKPVYMRRIAIEPKTVSCVRLGVHGLRKARIADRNLRAVPFESVQTQRMSDEIDRRTFKPWALTNRAVAIIWQGMNTNEPRASAAKPMPVIGFSHGIAGGRQRMLNPRGQIRIQRESAPAAIEKV